MSSRPTVSVALATYNGARYISEQLESIFAQTLLPDEVVICDDASSDTTATQLALFQKRFPDRLRVYHNETNLGFTRNFEKAISFCTGEIIILSDQDDFWLPHKVERLVDILQQNPQTGLVFSDAEIADQSLNRKGFTVYSRHPKPDLRVEKVLQSFVRPIKLLGCTCAFRTKYLPYLLPISSRWGHDHWIGFILAVISNLEMIDEPLMLYRRHDKNAGDTTAWDGNPMSFTKRKMQNLSKAHCENDYHGWDDMLQHLYRLQEIKPKGISAGAIERALHIVKPRLAFAQYRLSMRNKPRVLRFFPALYLYRNGDYSRYTRGSRTFFKDLVG